MLDVHRLDVSGGNRVNDCPVLSPCQRHLILAAKFDRQSATHAYFDLTLAAEVAKKAVILADLNPALNLRITEPDYMGFFNAYVPTLEADGSNGALRVTVRCMQGTDTPCELEFFDPQHPQLIEWTTDLEGNQLDRGRTMKFQGGANFHLKDLNLPSVAR